MTMAAQKKKKKKKKPSEWLQEAALHFEFDTVCLVGKRGFCSSDCVMRDSKRSPET